MARRGSSSALVSGRAAVIVGTGIGGAETIEVGIHNAYVTGQRVDPWSVPRLMPSAAASQLSARYGAAGLPSRCRAPAPPAPGHRHRRAGLRAGMVDRAMVGEPRPA